MQPLAFSITESSSFVNILYQKMCVYWQFTGIYFLNSNAIRSAPYATSISRASASARQPSLPSRIPADPARQSQTLHTLLRLFLFFFPADNDIQCPGTGSQLNTRFLVLLPVPVIGVCPDTLSKPLQCRHPGFLSLRIVPEELQFAYDTYGKLISRTGTGMVLFGYNGRDGVVTDDNELIYMKARYYSLEMKRFINADVVAGAISNV